MADSIKQERENVYAWNLSRNFPVAPETPVEREHLLDTLAQVASSDSPVVFIESAEGMGATTLLGQFAEKYASQTFCLFIRPSSRFSYSPDYLRLVLAEQYWWYLNNTRLQQDFVDSSEFESLQLRVRKRNRSGTIYVLVDGLHQIPRDDARMIDQICREVLPTGIDGFRFIITGSQDTLSPSFGSIRSKPYQLTRLSDTESDLILKDLGMNDADKLEVSKLCAGIPGRLSSVRRLVQSGVSASTILQSSPDKYLNFIGLEFSPISSMSSIQRLLLATLAFTRHTMSAGELVSVCQGATEEDIRELCRSCVFLNFNEQLSTIEFRSETHRRYAELALASLKQKALGLQIDHLVKNPTSAAAVRLLPSYYQSLNQQQAIIDLLSKEHYSQLLEVTQSLSALRSRAALGARSAMELGQATSVFRFALHRSIFTSVGSLEELQSEVGALVALGRSQKALEIAAQTVSREKRIFLLAEFAKRIVEQKGFLDPQVVAYIKETAAEIDFKDFGDSAVALAENLLFVDPDLALQIVEIAIKADSGTQDRDAAFVQLSLAASVSGSADKVDISEKTQAKISNESLQRLMASLSMIVADFSFDEIVKTAAHMDIGRRIYFLRSLVAASTRRANVLDVVDYALDELISNTAYSPKARDLADLALPLSFHGNDADRVKALVRRLEGQIGLIEKGAPSRDLTKLQMRLAHAELSFDINQANSRIEEAYYSVATMTNLEIRMLCLATMSSNLAQIDANGDLEEKNGFRAVIFQDLRATIDLLFAETSSHFRVIIPVISAIAQSDPVTAMDIVSRANTEARRDRAYAELAKILVRYKWSSQAANAVKKSISLIADPEVFDGAIIGIVQSLSSSPNLSEWLNDISALSTRARDPRTICSASISLVKSSQKLQMSEIASLHIKRFQDYVESIDSLYLKVDMYFELAATLAANDEKLALRLYEKGVDLRKTSQMPGESSGLILRTCLALLARVFRPLMKVGELPDDHLERFYKLADQLPCTLTKSYIYADLACSAWCEGRSELCSRIVEQKCKPLMLANDKTNSVLHLDVCEAIFPALYCAHRASAFALLETINESRQENSLAAAAALVLRKAVGSEPHDDFEDSPAKISHEDLIDICEILSRSPTDSFFYQTLRSAAIMASSKINRTRLSGQQRADFVSRVGELIAKKLPDKKNILHDGFVIVSNGQILRLVETRFEQWQELIERAECIQNTADKAYILIELARCLPTKFSAEKKRLLERARTLSSEIPMTVDRYERLEEYIRVTRKFSPVDAKSALKEAILLTFDAPRAGDGARYRRNLVDIAEAMESSILDDIAEMVDDDPARSSAKADIVQSVGVHKLRRKIAAVGDKVDPESLTSTSLPHAAWKNVSSLCAGKLEPKAPDFLSAYVDAAGSFSLREAFPVLSWYIENSARRFTSKHDVASRVLPLSEVLLLSTEIASSVISQAPSRAPTALDLEEHEQRSSAYIVKPGERSAALDHLRSWLRANPAEVIYYCDCYFSQADVEFLRLALAECPNSCVRVLTSRKAVTENGRDFSAESFLTEWNDILEQDPPETEILAITGFGGEEVLVHDRWLLAGAAGLRIGTSFNSIGGGKLSEISALSRDEALGLYSEIEQYFRRQRIVNGTRVNYSAVSF